MTATRDRKIDPITLDYVSDGRGGFVEVDVIENQIAISFVAAFSEWEGDSGLGHRFPKRETDTPATRLRLRDLAIDALRWLVEDGSLETVDVTVEHYDLGKVAFAVEAYRPGQSTAVELPTFLVSVGGSP